MLSVVARLTSSAVAAKTGARWYATSFAPTCVAASLQHRPPAIATASRRMSSWMVASSSSSSSSSSLSSSSPLFGAAVLSSSSSTSSSSSLLVRLRRVVRPPNLALLLAERGVKTKKAAAKRFIKTGSGHLKHGHAGKRHLTSHKAKDRKRRLNKKGILEGVWAKKMMKIM